MKGIPVPWIIVYSNILRHRGLSPVDIDLKSADLNKSTKIPSI